MGALYRRGQVWWMKYYVNGRPVRESTGVAGDTDTPPNEAKRVLKVKEGKAANGEPVMQRTDRVRYEEAAKDLRAHYRTTGDRDMVEAEKRLKHLDAFFTGYRLTGIRGGGSDKIRRHAPGRRRCKRDDQPRTRGARAHAEGRLRSREAAPHADHPQAARGGSAVRIRRAARAGGHCGEASGATRSGRQALLHARVASRRGVRPPVAPCRPRAWCPSPGAGGDEER